MADKQTRIKTRFSSKTFCFVPRPVVRRKVIARARELGRTISTVMNDTLERHA